VTSRGRAGLIAAIAATITVLSACATFSLLTARHVFCGRVTVANDGLVGNARAGSR
jgi:hypothetical protein